MWGCYVIPPFLWSTFSVRWGRISTILLGFVQDFADLGGFLRLVVSSVSVAAHCCTENTRFSREMGICRVLGTLGVFCGDFSILSS